MLGALMHGPITFWGRVTHICVNKLGIIGSDNGLPPGHVDRMPHDDVIQWKNFPRYWPFVQGIHRSPVNSSYKGQWCGALMFSLISAWVNSWVSNGQAGDLRRHRAHYDVIIIMLWGRLISSVGNGDNTLWQLLPAVRMPDVAHFI